MVGATVQNDWLGFRVHAVAGMAMPPLMVAAGPFDEVALRPTHEVLLSRQPRTSGFVTSHLPGKRHIVRDELIGHWERRTEAAVCKVRRGRDARVPGLLSLPAGSTNRSQLANTDAVEPEAMLFVNARQNVKIVIKLVPEIS